jgi:hypothetical protein
MEFGRPMRLCSVPHILGEHALPDGLGAIRVTGAGLVAVQDRPSCAFCPTRYDKGVCWEDTSAAGAVMDRVYPFRGCNGTCRAACGGSEFPRLSCRATGATVARTGDTRLRRSIPFRIRPKTWAVFATARRGQPGVRVGRRSECVRWVAPGVSGVAKGTGLTNDDR